MGKKAKFKQIRKIASQMPLIERNEVAVQVVSGSQLINEGVKEVEGKSVIFGANYKKKSVVKAPVNHLKNMKRLYNSHGIAGVGGYVNAVDNYTKAHAAH